MHMSIRFESVPGSQNESRNEHHANLMGPGFEYLMRPPNKDRAKLSSSRYRERHDGVEYAPTQTGAQSISPRTQSGIPSS
jgi:hypothetical protein